MFKTIAELRSDLAECLSGAETLCKAVKDGNGEITRDFTDEEASEHDGMLARADEIKLEIEKREATAKRVEKTSEDVASLKAPLQRKAPAITPEAGLPKEERKLEISDVMPRYTSIRSFKGPNAVRDAYISGKWVNAILWGNPDAHRWCADRGMFSHELRTAQARGVNSLGGALVPDEFSNTIIDLREEFGVFRKETRVMPMSSDTLIVARRASGQAAAHFGENSELTETNATFNNVQLIAKKIGVLTKYSKEVAEDAFIDIADWLAQEIAYAFAVKEDDDGFTGDGTSTDGGIVGLVKKFEDDESQVGAVTAASGNDTFAEITNTDLTTVMGTLPKYAKANAKWYVSSQGRELMFGRLQAAAGGNTIQSLTGGFGASYLGAPIVEVQTLPTTTGDLSENVMALYGDISMSSTMGDRRDIRLQIADQRYFEFDQLAIMGTERFDIVNHDIGDTTNAGPVVALIGD
jgi:HK97 family phage major capsid protein